MVNKQAILKKTFGILGLRVICMSPHESYLIGDLSSINCMPSIVLCRMRLQMVSADG